MDPLQPRLHGVLKELGYERVSSEEADLIIRIVAQRDQPKVVTRELSVAETGGPSNPDSIRFKNVAAMMGGGRYPQLLNDDPNAPGEVLLGPQGEIITTGRLRERPDMGSRPVKRVTVKINRLELSAMETAVSLDAADAGDAGIRWRVEIVSELLPSQP
ncbi:MAG: hypothetical protein J6386_03655 [Candidatus Synoicihabitans palmerolidicus]|nr:hypothetical protein [Candidatus Synoicihabitans palmerolidicus]